MEYEKRHWWRSSMPTGKYRSKSTRPRAVAESEYDNLKKMHQEKKPIADIAVHFCCSQATIRSMIKKLNLNK